MSSGEPPPEPAAAAAAEVVPAEDMPFAQLCELLERLHKKKTERQEQDRILTSFFDDFRINAAQIPGPKNCSLFPVMRLLLPALDRERGAYHLKEASLGATLARVLALPPASPDAARLTAYRAVTNAQDSDLAGVAYFVFKNRLPRQSGAGGLTVKAVNDVLDKIANAQVGGKARVLDEAFGAVFRQLSAEQLKWFLRVLLKDLRVRVGSTRLLAAMHPDAPDLYDACSSLLKTCAELEPGSARPLELGVQVFMAVSPMLSERLDVTRVARLPRAAYVVEHKFDGERFQIHMRDGVFEYFSRKGHAYGAHYGVDAGGGLLTPRLAAGIAPSAASIVLDGEMMGWHKQRHCFGSKGMSFDVKKITANSAFQPCFCAFDVLYYNGRSLAGGAPAGGAPLRERLAVLDAVVTDVPGALMRSQRRPVTDHSEILEALNEAMERQEEGIVVKDLDSHYLANRRNAGWYKIKPEYTEGTMVELDLVVVGAEEAGDKTHGRARSFHVACVDHTARGPRWVVAGRAATGLTDAQRERLCATLERRWVPRRESPPPACLVFNKEKPDFWIMPEHSIILQIRATELIRSTDYGTSHTLRFPRVTAVRDDKPVQDAMTLAEFNALVADGAVVKLSKRAVPESALEPGAAPPPRRQRTARALEVPAHLRTAPAADVEVRSAALRGREVCVLGGDAASSKAELVRLVRAHGGTHVENVGPNTWCCVSGRRVFRADARDLDVASAGWLRALPAGAAAPAPAPAPPDLLRASRGTRAAACRRYDRFGDSYARPTDEDALRRCFAEVDQEPEIHLTHGEMLELDRLLFGDRHPFSFLRACTLYFPAPSALSVAARMRGATVADADGAGAVTHAVLPRGAGAALVRSAGRPGRLVVSEDWLAACIDRQEYVNEKPFLFNSIDLYVP